MRRLIVPFGLGRAEGETNEKTRLSFSYNVKEGGTNEAGTFWERSLVFMKSLTTQAKASIVATIIVLCIAAIALCIVLSLRQEPGYETAAVSTDSAPCAVIGKNILEKNGTAVDAAIAVLACMGVVNPQSSGLGGGFLMLYYNRSEGKAYYINAREACSTNANKDMFNGNASAAKLGPHSIAIPGETRGYWLAHSRYGKLSWAELFQPTIEMCEEGIPVTPQLARALERNKENLQKFPVIKKVFTNDSTGELYKYGDVYKREKLAETFKLIAEQKFDNIDRQLRLDLSNTRSIVNDADFRLYTIYTPNPISKNLSNTWTLHSARFPGSGSLLALMLGVLDGYTTREGTVTTLHRMIETFKFANARRMDFGEYSQVESELISEEYADKVRDAIDVTKTFNDVKHYGVNASVQDDHGGAHVSIIAPNGDAVSATSSINTDFGSMILSPNTGIILNNQMNSFSLPNITESFGLPLTKMNFIGSRKQPFSSMSPAIVTDSNGDVVMAIGGTGGTKITTSMAQVIINSLWMGKNIKQAVDDPRLHHQLLPNYIEYEEKIPKDILEELKKMGHNLSPATNGVLGSVTGVVRDGPYLYANSDYRKGGGVDGI